MSNNSSQFTASYALVFAAAFVIVVAGMRLAEAIVVPFLLSAFLAIVFSPPIFWLQRKKIPTALAVLIVIIGVVLVVLSMAVVIGSSMDEFMQALPEYQQLIKERTQVFLLWFESLNINLSNQAFKEQLDPGILMNFVGKMLNSLGSLLANTLLILLTIVFMLLEAASFPAKMHSVFKGNKESLFHLQTIIKGINRYVIIKTGTSFITALLVTIWLAILEVDFPIVWGLLAFVLNFIPNIGSFIAAIPAILLSLVQLGTGSALLVALGYGVINIVIGSFLEPRFMGKGVGLSTLVVFLSLVFWGWVLGPIGMLLSVPLTMTLKIALDNSGDMRWLATLLGPGFSESDDDHY